MRWRGRKQSSNIEDRRGRGGFMRSRKGVSGGAAIILILAGLFFGTDVQNILSLFVGNSAGPMVQQPAPDAGRSRQDDEVAQFASVILAETEQTWSTIFAQAGQRYRPPIMVYYDGRTGTACGAGSAASGPFYCPADQKIYIDLSFLNELKHMGAPGDFAFAYVIAHEVGHHIQTITGISDQVRQRQARAGKAGANALSVKQELQADCLAGVWIHHTEKRSRILEQGDIQEGFAAAAAVGDDTIMKRAGIPPRRENFTHGSAEQRMHWFQQGMQSGNWQQCHTYG